MQNLFSSLKMGLINPVYLFYGEEKLLIGEALTRLKQLIAPENSSWNVETIQGRDVSPAQVVELASDGGFFCQKRLLIVRDCIWLSKKQGKSSDFPRELDPLIEYCADPNPDTVLVLILEQAPDKKMKIIQKIAQNGRIVEFPLLKGTQRELWMKNYLNKHGFSIDKQALGYISLAVNGGCEQLKLELEKLILYCSENRQITMPDVEEIISKNSLFDIFALCDAASLRNASATVAIYRDLLQQGEAEQYILYMLARHYSNIIAVKDLRSRGYSPRDAAEAMGIHPYTAEKCLRAANQYNMKQLTKALDILLAADNSNKNGQTSLKQGLELAIYRICAL